MVQNAKNNKENTRTNNGAMNTLGLVLKKLPVILSKTIESSNCCFQQVNNITTNITQINPNIAKKIAKGGILRRIPAITPPMIIKAVNPIIP